MGNIPAFILPYCFNLRRFGNCEKNKNTRCIYTNADYVVQSDRMFKRLENVLYVVSKQILYMERTKNS